MTQMAEQTRRSGGDDEGVFTALAAIASAVLLGGILTLWLLGASLFADSGGLGWMFQLPGN